MSSPEEVVDFVIDQYDGEEIESIEDLNFEEILNMCSPSLHHNETITLKLLNIVNTTLYLFPLKASHKTIIASGRFVSFLVTIVETERNNTEILQAALHLLMYILQERLLSDSSLPTLICPPIEEKKAKQKERLPSPQPVFTACLNLVESSSSEISILATICIILMSQLFPSYGVDPITPNVVVHTCFRTFVDQFLLLLNARSTSELYKPHLLFSPSEPPAVEVPQPSLYLSYLLHIVSIPDLCRGICFGNNLVIIIDILLRLIDQTDMTSDDGFTVLLCLDSLLRNSEYLQVPPPHYKQDIIASSMKELSGSEYPEEVQSLSQTILSSYPELSS